MQIRKCCLLKINKNMWCFSPRFVNKASQAPLTAWCHYVCDLVSLYDRRGSSSKSGLPPYAEQVRVTQGKGTEPRKTGPLNLVATTACPVDAPGVQRGFPQAHGGFFARTPKGCSVAGPASAVAWVFRLQVSCCVFLCFQSMHFFSIE